MGKYLNFITGKKSVETKMMFSIKLTADNQNLVLIAHIAPYINLNLIGICGWDAQYGWQPFTNTGFEHLKKYCAEWMNENLPIKSATLMPESSGKIISRQLNLHLEAMAQEEALEIEKLSNKGLRAF